MSREKKGKKAGRMCEGKIGDGSIVSGGFNRIYFCYI